MSKKPVARRPDEKPTGRGPGAYDPGSPEAGRMPEDSPERKRFETPEGRPIDKPFPAPGAGGRGKDIFEGDRSDRESGRPVQLEEDEDGTRSDRESGRPLQLDREERPSEERKGRQAGSPREAEPPKR